jgi:hypothetical protein
MPRLITPTDQEFSLTVESRYPEREVGLDDPIVVKFKQATEATNLKRQEYLARPIKRMWENGESGESQTGSVSVERKKSERLTRQSKTCQNLRLR